VLARSAESGNPSIDDRDGLTIIAPSDPPRLGPLTARVLLKILLDAAQRAAHDPAHNPDQTPAPPPLQRP